MTNKTKGIKRLIYILLAGVALTISLDLNRSYTSVETYLKDFLLQLNKIIIYKTNAATKDQTESYLIQKHLNESLENEIKELKELLKLNITHSSYEKVNSTVISRNNIHWLNTITIDKGKKDGIEVGMAVITTNGLIGKITKTTFASSEVKLLTSSDVTNKTSVLIRVDGKDYYAILSGYEEDLNLLKVTAIDKSVSIKNGDTVLTSGLGNMPQGLYIGTVATSEVDKYNLSKTVYIKSKQDFSTINYVTVLKEKTK